MTAKNTTTNAATPITSISLAERLFNAEAELRAAAIHFADWDRSDTSKNLNPTRTAALNNARKNLRAKAIAYAKLADEVDGK